MIERSGLFVVSKIVSNYIIETLLDALIFVLIGIVHLVYLTVLLRYAILEWIKPGVVFRFKAECDLVVDVAPLL